LGLATQASTSFDWGTPGVVAEGSLAKLKEGVAFYGEGTKILFSDLEYASVLIVKAVQVRETRGGGEGAGERRGVVVCARACVL
jgi:hypothetical protein